MKMFKKLLLIKKGKVKKSKNRPMGPEDKLTAAGGEGVDGPSGWRGEIQASSYGKDKSQE